MANITRSSSDWAKRLYVLKGNEDEEVIAEFIREKISTFDTQNARTRRQWVVNAGMARGNQWSVLHETDDRLVQYRPHNLDRKMITDDMIGPWKRHIVANLTMAKPAWEPQPTDMRYDSILASRTAREVLDYYWQEWKMLAQQITLAAYMVDFNNALIFLRYNEGKMTPTTGVYADGSIAYNDDGTPIMAFEPIRDIDSMVLQPQALVCPLDPSDLDEKPWMGIRIARDIGYFEDAYKNGDTVTPEGNSWDTLYALKQLSRDQRYRMPKADETNEVFWYQKPCEANPDGMMVIYANGVILKQKNIADKDQFKWPLGTITTYPAIHVHGLRESGEFWARSSIEQQIPLQKYLNLLRSCEADNTVNTAHTKWLVHSSNGIDQISDINEMLEWDGQVAPGVLAPPQINLTQQIESVKASIRDIQNYHGASLGGSVSGVRSDLHAQNLQEQDLLPLSVIDNNIALAYSEMGEKVLSMIAEGIDDARTLSFIKDGRPIVIENFKGSMLSDVRKVRVKLTDTRLRAKGAVKQEIYQWFSAGMITDRMGNPDPHKAMELLEFALPDTVFEDERGERNQAQLEIYQMVKGEVAKPYPWQNHMIHLKVHEQYMNSPEFMQFLAAAEAGDEAANQVVQLVVAHVQATSDMWQAAAPKPQSETNQRDDSGNGNRTEPQRQQE